MPQSPADSAMQAWLSSLALQNSLVIAGVPTISQSPRVFERSLIAALGDTSSSYSVGFNLNALRNAAFQVRARLSQEQWDLIVQCEQDFAQQITQSLGQDTSPNQAAVALLSATGVKLAAITGAQTDRMTRDDGWRLLSAGRLLERLQFLASSLLAGFECGTLRFDSEDGSTSDAAGFEAMLALFDSTTTFRAHHGHRSDLASMLETLLLDQDNPRSLAWVVKTLRGRLAKLSGDAPQEECALSLMLADVSQWQLIDLLGRDAQGQPSALIAVLRQCIGAVSQVTQAIGAQYFTHSSYTESTWGA
jgi:uncharacterized alpha-E superfamily protein